MKKIIFVVGFVVALSNFGFAQQKMFTLRGIVSDEIDGRPLKGIKVFISGTDYSTTTNENGHYLFRLPAGEYEVIFSSPGYRSVTQKVDLKRRMKILDISMLSQPTFIGEELIIKAERPELQPSRQVLTKEVVSEPSTDLFSSVSEGLKTLPGIASLGDFSGLLFIRGASPWESTYILDRVFIHFPFRWGGMLDVFNQRLVDRIELYTGAFPSWVGNTIGGVIDVKYRKGTNKKFSGEFNLSPVTAEILLEGPVKRPGPTYIFSAKRTHYDLLIRLFDAGNVFPYFNELYGKVNWQVDEKHDFNLFNLYTDEGMKVKMTAEEARAYGGEEFEFDYKYFLNVTGFNWQYKISPELTNNLTLSRNAYKGDFEFYSPDSPFDMKLDLQTYFLRKDITYKLSSAHALQSGIHTHWTGGDWRHTFRQREIVSRDDRLEEIVEITEMNLQEESYHFGPYLSHRWQISSPLTLNYGVRYEHLSIPNKGALTPRISASYLLDDLTTLKTAAGVYANFVDLSHYDKKSGNRNLGPQYSHEFLVGVERTLKEDIRSRLEVYRRNLTELVVRDEVLNYANKGRGFVDGIELFLEKRPSERAKLDGWISYTYCVSRRTIGGERPHMGTEQHDREAPYVEIDPEKLFPTEADQTHNFSVVLNYKLPKRWKISCDWRYNTGRPYTPVVGARSYTLPTGETLYYPIMGEYNSGRLPPYHRLDVKISRPHRYRWGELTWYVQFLNLYNNKNIHGYYYSDDYGQRYESKMAGFMFLGGVEIKF